MNGVVPRTVTAALTRALPGGAPAWWLTVLVAVLVAAFAVGGLLLSQAAYRGGLAAPLALVNLSNPAAATVIGVALLGESFRGGAWGWSAAVASAALAARGVVLLTRGGAQRASSDTARPSVGADTPRPAVVPAPRGPGTSGGASPDGTSGSRSRHSRLTPHTPTTYAATAHGAPDPAPSARRVSISGVAPRRGPRRGCRRARCRSSAAGA